MYFFKKKSVSCAHLALCDVEGGQTAGAVTAKETKKRADQTPRVRNKKTFQRNRNGL